MERKREESASSAFLSSSPESAVPLETQQRWFLCVLFLIAGFFDSCFRIAVFIATVV